MRIRLLLLGLVLLCGACSGDPPAYLHRVYVDGLVPAGPGEAAALVRFLDDEGAPAPAADAASLTPVVLGEPVGRVRAVQPLRDQGVVVALVIAAHLPQSLFEPTRVGYRRVLDALGPADRVLLAAVQAAAEPQLLSPAAARRALDALAPPPGPSVLGPAMAGRRRTGPIGWALAPQQLLDQSLSVLERHPDAPRRAILLVLEGRSIGRTWTPFVQAAAATGTALHLITVPPPDRSQLPGRIERPFFLYAASDVAGLPGAFDVAVQGVAGGHLVRFDTERSGLALADGFGVRTRLPRGGWQEFSTTPLETPPAVLTLGDLRPLGPGRWAVAARATDARGEPLVVEPGGLSLWARNERLELLPEAPPAAPATALAVVVTVPEGTGEAAGQRAAIVAALDALPAGASALVATSGQLPFGPHAFDADLAGLRAKAQAAQRPLAIPARDLQADLQDLLRQTRGAAEGSGKLLLVVTGTRPLRQARGRGRGTYRFRSLLHLLRRTGVTPLWIAVGPPADYEQLRPVLRSLAGGDLWVLPTWEGVPALTTRVVHAVTSPPILVFGSDLDAPALTAELQGRVAHRGHAVRSQNGLPRAK